ncbi:ABC transporter permease [Leifsonia sp. 21MFCrub1.1]|uniref:ABC transporter permease n=1 Tax=Leifsonia sp. 21MFCrub1.1 TaxID=1798223 RepID=UPI00089297F3|nr:ABC transporter permease [Leifsonia sp. 21MFCrub1.1]SEB08697.1 putative ABC transport system permease protein [Leifsonia sp. 21MFCrub1.1]
MKTTDLIRSAVANTFRSKTRTILTILAIFVGAFTLTLTNGLGTGINDYIANTVSGVGAADSMTVTKADGNDGTAPAAPSANGAPREYNPDAVSSGIPGSTVTALTPHDIETIGGIQGVVAVQPVRTINPDYVQASGGTRYVAGVASLIPGQTTVLGAGAAPDSTASTPQVAIPSAYVDPLGFGSASDAIGSTLTFGITDADRAKHTIEATIVGVTKDALASPTGASLLINSVLSDALFDAQSTGLSAEQADRYASASARFDSSATSDDIQAIKDRLAKAGFTGRTVADQLGTITSVIDAIVLVLNAFAIIALLAAAFGIVNTLYMSVQERTREIGLMKAMGMGSARVFSLFSLEATFIGFLGSALGAGIAMLVGAAISGALSNGLFSNLPGLTLITFDPVSIVGTILLVMAIAFVSGTLPAVRAATADPVTSLRYE